MNFPFIKRAELAVATERVRWMQEALDDAKAKAAYLQVQCEQLKQSLSDSQAERHKLTDRILRMSGQPPLYELAIAETAAAAAAPTRDLKDLAKADVLPVAGVTFRGVHTKAREAMANGTFDIDKARARV